MRSGVERLDALDLDNFSFDDLNLDGFETEGFAFDLGDLAERFDNFDFGEGFAFDFGELEEFDFGDLEKKLEEFDFESLPKWDDEKGLRVRVLRGLRLGRIPSSDALRCRGVPRQAGC